MTHDEILAVMRKVADHVAHHGIALTIAACRAALDEVERQNASNEAASVGEFAKNAADLTKFLAWLSANPHVWGAHEESALATDFHPVDE